MTKAAIVAFTKSQAKRLALINAVTGRFYNVVETNHRRERLMKVLTCQRSQHVNIDTLAADDIVALAEYLSTQGSYNLDVIRI